MGLKEYLGESHGYFKILFEVIISLWFGKMQFSVFFKLFKSTDLINCILFLKFRD